MQILNHVNFMYDIALALVFILVHVQVSSLARVAADRDRELEFDREVYPLGLSRAGVVIGVCQTLARNTFQEVRMDFGFPIIIYHH